ncbi:uncharacterized protein EV154DRAFT_599678 [Mucor mucedo]|uniref:uncharacterized protein n=1 Tax=Mucor mucedo TaxID=29922 RepID=UPI0022200BCB|nr:uncharacterized protein EV154DRAFT_599678 [Mucor mucedo]KAI7894857.1 hypothetical protein EV154DRAFT_599678 [Mucor mucedo]
MDFTSAPFQALLVQNAADEQLLGFLNQLDEQYTHAVDEKVRFGNLQILLPILKAHLARLDDHEKEEACLEQFVKPWMITSFSQESMVATESVTLLENTVSYLVGRSLLLHANKKDNTFGKETLLLFITQLISAMEAEPDFVDLKPLDFIESSIEQLNCRSQWDQVQTAITVQDTASHILLDLECCLEVLTRFVRDLNENQELLSLNVTETAQTEIRQWMELIFTIAVAMIPCTNATIRSKLSHGLLPNLLRWQQSPTQNIELKDQVYWCEMVWKRTLQMFALPATNLLRLEIYGLIARFFDFYFGLNDGAPVIRKDLRFDANFFKILQSGLQSNDSLARKYSSYILKRIIDFTEKTPSTIADKSDSDWTPYFKWNAELSNEYIEHWDDWFLLYDIMHENVIHLVEPVLPRFETLLNANALDASWWVLLMYRGFQNDTSSVKKGLLEFIFSREDPSILNKMGIEQGFMFGALFKTVDSTALFAVPTQGTLVSPFGEHFREFMRRLVQAFEKEQDKINFLRQLIHHLSHVVSSHAPILYTMEALAEVDYVDAWGPEELKSLRVLVDRHRNFNIPATKQFLRKLGIAAVVKLSNTATLSFSDIAKTISSLVSEYPIKTNSKEFKLIRYWLETRISKDKSLDSILGALKDRIKTYVCDLKSEDIPEAVLRTQANVLARTSIFVVSSMEGELNTDDVLDLLSVFIARLKDSSCDEVTFARILTLFNALWENFGICFETKCSFTKVIGLTDENMLNILTRIGQKYLNKVEENVVDDDLAELYLSLTRRILSSENALAPETRKTTVKSLFDHCVELLKYRSPSVDANKEMSKPNYIRLLNIVYASAIEHSYFTLGCDSPIVKLVYGLPMKRTQEALRERSWGDCLSSFIRVKWECIENIVRYASIVKKNNIEKEFFDPIELFEEAVEQLENGSEMCGEALIRSFGPILAFPWDKTPEMIERCVDYAIALMMENIAQSRTFPLLIKAFVDVIFQPELLCIPELNEDNGPMKKALHMVLQTGDLKPFVVAQTSKLLHNFWSTFSEDANKSMVQYAPEIAKLLVFGPLRDRGDQKLEAAIAAKLATPTEILEAEGTAETVFSQNDYLVRVDMNDLLLRLDVNNKDHKLFANILLENFFRIINEDILFEFMYTSTMEHRLKLRICCSTILIIDLADESKLDDYMKVIFEVMRKETVTSVRCYLEWAMVRILCRFPQRLPALYEKLGDANHKPNFVISLLTLTFTLCDNLPQDHIEGYFKEIFVCLIPWLITNHFTIRLFSYCAWQRNWKSCIQHGYGKQLEENRYLQSIGRFMETYVDCIKFYDKIQTQFYMTKFDPIQDFNIEFIFRQMMTEFGVIENERIGSKAFLRVNPHAVERCPFENPKRKELYTSADPSEMIGIEEEIELAEASSTSSNNGLEEVIQKKIMPWEMMLETDMDLTKNLVQKNRRRNDLIVVASLIDRLPNLAGLCRTCEIFNASTLVVPTLKIKDDLGFTTISVSSEKWMPMIEVVENDVAKYLQEKKEQGYTLCGLEQTTTSATLGDYEFPEKCVLLLGKERQGVPADLLQMLDVTIEIPQYGITRSLNVHVSGAICIYEYTKQMHWRQQAAITQ